MSVADLNHSPGSRSRLSLQTGLSPLFFHYLLLGERRPSLTSFLKIAKALDCTLEELYAALPGFIEIDLRRVRVDTLMAFARLRGQTLDAFVADLLAWHSRQEEEGS